MTSAFTATHSGGPDVMVTVGVAVRVFVEVALAVAVRVGVRVGVAAWAMGTPGDRLRTCARAGRSPQPANTKRVTRARPAARSA